MAKKLDPITVNHLLFALYEHKHILPLDDWYCENISTHKQKIINWELNKLYFRIDCDFYYTIFALDFIVSFEAIGIQFM